MYMFYVMFFYMEQCIGNKGRPRTSHPVERRFLLYTWWLTSSPSSGTELLLRWFLVACTKLYNSLCWMVRPSFRPSVDWSVHHAVQKHTERRFDCPCSPICNWYCRVYGLVFIHDCHLCSSVVYVAAICANSIENTVNRGGSGPTGWIRNQGLSRERERYTPVNGKCFSFHFIYFCCKY